MAFRLNAVWFVIAVFGAIDMNPLFALLFGVTEGSLRCGDLSLSLAIAGVGLRLRFQLCLRDAWWPA